MTKLDGKFAVVTGAGSGMGRAIAKRFAAEGATVAALDLNLATSQATADEIVANGGNAIAVAVDVSDSSSVAAAANTVLAETKAVDVIVNNAGILDGYANLLDTTEELWDRIIDVDLKSMYLVTRAFLPAMIDGGGGSIVNIASIAGIVAGGGGIAYTSAKHGVIGFTKQLSADFGKNGVRANSICPGAVETGMTKEILESGDAKVMDSIRSVPAGRYAQPEEVANLALFLAGEESSFVYGAACVIDGGWTIL